MQREFPSRPFVGVGVVVWQGDKVLLIQRGKMPKAGQWSLPGGAQELGETLAETAAREVLEETHVEIGTPHLVEVVDSIQRDDDGRVRYHYTLIDFTAEWRAGDAMAGGDAAAAIWVTPAELGRFELWSETIRVIEKAAEIRARHRHEV